MPATSCPQYPRIQYQKETVVSWPDRASIVRKGMSGFAEWAGLAFTVYLDKELFGNCEVLITI